MGSIGSAAGYRPTRDHDRPIQGPLAITTLRTGDRNENGEE